MVDEMPLKLLMVLGSDSRLGFVAGLAEEALRSGQSVGVVFFGNSLYGLRLKGPPEELEGASLFAHEGSMAERGITLKGLSGRTSIIGDDKLLDLMLSSEKTICI